MHPIGWVQKVMWVYLYFLSNKTKMVPILWTNEKIEIIYFLIWFKINKLFHQNNQQKNFLFLPSFHFPCLPCLPIFMCFYVFNFVFMCFVVLLSHNHYVIMYKSLCPFELFFYVSMGLSLSLSMFPYDWLTKLFSLILNLNCMIQKNTKGPFHFPQPHSWDLDSSKPKHKESY